MHLQCRTSRCSSPCAVGKEAAYEVVVNNPNLIADQIEWIYPTAGQYPPFTLPNAYEDLKQLCTQRLQLLYPGKLPGEVQTRLEEETAMLEKADYASLYMLTHHIASYLRKKGAYMGARGPLGSTLAAYLLEISDTNPLPAHYHCPRCGHANFNIDAISGVDLPTKACPCCGADMRGDGHNIPYETCMGVIAGDLKPTIEINTPGEMRLEILQFLTELLGKERVAYAGTVGRISAYLAQAYIHVYRDACEEIKATEDDRIAEKLRGIKNSEGNHPGGIVLLPEGMDFEDVTPLRKLEEPMYGIDHVTHMDYYSIEHVLPKFNILSHSSYDHLTALFALTGVKPENIDYSDQAVHRLFLNGDTDDLPEFANQFTKELVQRLQPKNFSDLVKISGIAHGTNVWCDNAEHLLKTHHFHELIGDRDDIFLSLQNYGVDRSTAYRTMCTVRKGRFGDNTDRNAELTAKLRFAGVPEWYIRSMKKIKYLFPKAHAVTYVKLAFSLAWFKHYYPEQFLRVIQEDAAKRKNAD